MIRPKRIDSTVKEQLQRDGFCMLVDAIDCRVVEHLRAICHQTFAEESNGVRARSSRGHVYAARNLIQSIPEVSLVWRDEPIISFLQECLGSDFGLVRALFFDKPPERTWNLPWHKDTSIAVRANQVESEHYSRPTVKAGVPHLIASDEILRMMLTLRIHLDEVNNENGPLRVIPRSHVSSESNGAGIDEAFTVHARPGDVLAMRPLISHASGSSIEGTTRHRRILHLEFAASSILPDNVKWYDFVSAAEQPK